MAKKIISARMQQRHDTRAAWEAANPVLLDGELGLVSDDPGLYKMGDGVTPWNGLPYRGFDGSIVQEPGSSTRSVMSQAAVTAKLSELGRQLEDKAGKGDLAEVAKTGSYDDLKDTPELAKVAGSGDYKDLENLPSFATVNGQRIDQGGEIHIEAGGPEIVVDSVLSEDSTNPVQNQAVAKAVAGKQDLLMNGINIKTINGENILGRGNITIEGGGAAPDLSGYATKEDLEKKQDADTLAKVATSGSYGDLKDKPTFATVNGKRIDQGGNIQIEGGEGGSTADLYPTEYSSEFNDDFTN